MAKRKPPEASPQDTWLSRLDRDHHLVGRIWKAKSRSFVNRRLLLKEMAGNRYLLFGERHDNPDHHRLQAELLNALVETGRRPAVVFEMLNRVDQKAIDQYLSANSRDVDGLANAVKWDESGWPQWSLYRPVFAATLHNGLRVLAGNLTRERTRDVARQGTAALDPDFVARHGLDRALPAPLEARLIAHLREAHCGCMPEPMLSPMLLVQRTRDAVMADTLRAADSERGAALIAGSEHVRDDFGVPSYLSRLRHQPSPSPSARKASVRSLSASPHRAGAQADKHENSVSLAFVEVAAETERPEAYADRYGAEELPFDYVWFTPRANDDDPCEELRKRFPHCPKQP